MSSWDPEKTPYQILGFSLDQGPELTDDELKKVYRKLAIQKHPDKQKNNPNAAVEFAELDQAYKFLLDKQARGALDDFIRSKQRKAARDSETDAKRRKLREELEKREAQASVATRTEEELARTRLKMELERMRRQVEEQVAADRQQRAHAAAVAAAAVQQQQTQSAIPGSELNEQLNRTVKVSWNPSLHNYSTDEIRTALETHGAVEEVVLKDRRKAHKAVALVVMESAAAASRACQSVCGDATHPLLVLPLMPVASNVPEASALNLPYMASSANGSASSSGIPGVFPSGRPLFAVSGGTSTSTSSDSKPSDFMRGTTFSSFPGSSSQQTGAPAVYVSQAENEILEKMKRAQERKRMLEELQTNADG